MHKGKRINAKSLILTTLIVALLIGGHVLDAAAYQAWQQGIPQSILSIQNSGSIDTGSALANIVVSSLPPFSVSNSEYAIRAGSSAIIQNIQDINAAIAIIESYAASSDASSLAISLLISAGANNLVPDNLAAYKQGIATAMVDDVDQTPDLQGLINRVNVKVGLIASYAANSDAATMTLDELIAAGIGGLEPYLLSEYRDAIAGVDTEDADTATDIQKIIDAVNSASAGKSGEASIASLLHAPRGRLNRIYHEVIVGGIGIQTYSYKVDGGDWSEETAVGEPLEFDVSTAGEHTLYVIGKNGNGTWQPPDNATKTIWTLDLTPPTALVLNEPLGTCGLSAIDLAVGGQDVQFYRYRQCTTGCEWSRIYPVSVPIALTGLTDGLQSLAVIGADTAGNWQAEADQTEIFWQVDGRLPTAIFTNAPAAAIRDRDTTLSVGHKAGELEVNEYKFSLDDGITWAQQSVSQGIEITAMTPGQYTVYVNGYNSAGDKWQDDLNGETLDNATEYSWVVDHTAPRAPTLTAAAGTPASTAISLAWTAPESGLKCYHIYYAQSPITEESRAEATRLYNAIVPCPGGCTERITIDGLTPDTAYYAAIQAEDAAGNLSDLSNNIQLATLDRRPEIADLYLTAGGLTGDNHQARELTVVGKNFVGTTGGNIVRFISSKGVFDVFSKAGSTTTKLFADVPRGACRGNYRLKVINKHGVSAGSSMTYSISQAPSALPEVDFVLPASGSEDADTSLTISGRNFDNPVSVSLISLDGHTTVNLTQIIAVDATTLRATVPAWAAVNIYCIRVTTAQGTNDTSLARFEVFQAIDLDGSNAPVKTTRGVVLPADARVPVDITLATDDREEIPPASGTRVKIEVSIDSGSEFEAELTEQDWIDYSGVINPPRPIAPPSEAVAAIGKNVVAFTMGPDKSLRLKNGMTMFVKVEVAMASSLPAPVVYYIPTVGAPVLAGVNGVRDGITYNTGGNILATRIDVPEDGYTTYTIGLLLDHMSVYAAGVPPAVANDDSGFCFIGTFTNGSQPTSMPGLFDRFGNRLMIIFLLALAFACPAALRGVRRLHMKPDSRL